MNHTDYILNEIKLRGAQNLAAIKAHHESKAGARGAVGLNGRKSEMRGIARPVKRKIKAHPIKALRPAKFVGKPMKCDGTDGYKRDRITGVITKCVAAA